MVILILCIAILGCLILIIFTGSEIKQYFTYKRWMRNSMGEAKKNAKEWILLDQRETRDQLIRDWKEINLGPFWPK